MTDWELIKSGERPRTLYQEFRKGQALAVCAPDWRNGGPLEKRDFALLSFYFFQAKELFWKYTLVAGPIVGALTDFAMQHPAYEVYYNEELL